MKKIFPQLLKNVRVKDKKTALDNAAVQAAVEKTAEELGTDGRVQQKILFIGPQ